jgi:tetratricopeptide (TPR) repeat protein
VIAHLALNQPEAVDTDIVAVIALAQTKYEKDSTDWQNTCNLALYHVVANDFDKANGLYRSAIAEAPNDLLQEAQRDLQNFLRVFPGHAIAQQMVTLLETGTES